MTEADGNVALNESNFELPQFEEDLQWFTANSPSKWHEAIDVNASAAIRATIAVLGLVTQEWTEMQPKDTMPIRTVQAVMKYLDGPSSDLKKNISVLCKGCSRSRQRTLGYQHRIAEAVRALADAATETESVGIFKRLGEVLSKVEEHLLFRHAVKGEYGQEKAARSLMIKAYAAELKRLTNKALTSRVRTESAE